MSTIYKVKPHTHTSLAGCFEHAMSLVLRYVGSSNLNTIRAGCNRNLERKFRSCAPRGRCFDRLIKKGLI